MNVESAEELSSAWASESYARFAKHYLAMAARLVEETAVEARDDVLDVGCGTGNVAITAARQGAQVTGLDINPAMLEGARENAEIARVNGIEWRQGAATALPFEENAFDVTLSNLGHMYGDPPNAAARELIRVTRPGGRLGFTSWTPSSLFPRMAGDLVAHLDPEDQPAFTVSPFMWGDRDVVAQRLGSHVRDLTFESRSVRYPALSPGHFWHAVTTHAGPFITLLEKVDDRSVVREAILESIEPNFDADTNAIELEFLLTSARICRTE